VLWAILATVACLGLTLVSPAPAAYAVSFAVNSDGDAPDAGLDGTCDTGAGPGVVCTLRAAIEESNNSAGPNTITFAIPANAPNTRPDGVRVIFVRGTAPCTCDLPIIATSVTIDGRSQGTGANNAPTILILPDPTTPPPGNTGLWVDTTTATIAGLAIGGFGDGIFLSDGTGTSIKGSYLGVDPDGSTPIANGVGIDILDADGFDIGGPTAADRNVIAGNGSHGIGIDQSSLCGCGGTALSRIRNNLIGLRADGDTPAGNGGNGISIFDGDTILVGGVGQGNVISGNTGDGVTVIDVSQDVEISANLIGTNAAGMAARKNFSNGISLAPISPVDPGPINTTIGSGATGAGNLIAGNTFNGISVLNSFTTTIKGNLLGLAADGTTALPNGGEAGIMVEQSYLTAIGGTAETDRNVISGNTGSGIKLVLTLSTTIFGNFIGVAADGRTARPNVYGIIDDTTDDTDIGSATPGGRNVISGNQKDGIRFETTCGCGGSGNNVRGNYIGLGADGTTVVANGENGIQVYRVDGADIGDTPLGSGNTISGNLLSGILLVGIETADMDIFGNRIGTDATGLLARGNGLDGVTAIPVDPTDSGSLGPLSPFIGSSDIGSGNLISGNGRHGISMLRAQGDFSNDEGIEIGRNLIGVAANGNGVLPNGGDGILLDDSAQAAVFENTVANNGRGGVVMAFNLASVDNAISANSIYNNGGLGIDLTPSVDANGVGDGRTANVPNGSTNYPVLASATTSAVGTVIAGTLNAASDTAYRVELFASPACDPSGYGEGRAYLGAVDVQTDANGDAVFATTAGAIPAGQVVTATASNDDTDQTSEFSACLPATAAAVLVTPTSGLVTTESGASATFTVALSTLPTADVTIGLTSSKPGEATVSPASLTFTSSDGTTPKTVTVTGVTDGVADGNHPFTIVTAPASSLDPSYNGIDPPDVFGLNQDSSTLPTLSIHSATVTEGTGVTTPMPFSVTLAPASLQSVTVSWQVIDGTAQAATDLASAPSGALTFAPGETSKTIDLRVIGDNIPEQNETFTVRLFGANVVIGTDTATGTITNDDGAPGPCAPRPNVTLSIKKTGTDQIVVTVTAGSGTIKTIAFGSAQKPIENALVETLNPSAIIQTYGTFTAPAGVTQQAFIVRRIAPNQPVMVSLLIEDGCGTWPTFVGAGPTGF
jgi:hypothetical protein